jgi:hypothetical protein
MGASRKKLTDKPSISGHAKLIADFINGISHKRTSGSCIGTSAFTAKADSGVELRKFH